MNDRYDAIIVGAGHNGMVCGSLLAKAGKKVLILEAAAQVGGAAITRSFAEGYSVSACAHLLYQLQPQVQKELGLKVDLVADDMATIALSRDGNHLKIHGDRAEGISDDDAENLRAFHGRMTRYADLLNKFLNKRPPRLGSRNVSDMFTLAQLGLSVRRLGRDDMREFLRLIGINIFDELEEKFENPLLKGALSVDAVMGTHLGPRSPNTILTYLYRLAGNHGRVGQPAGGMGSISEMLAHSARDNGATVRTSMPVKRIVVDNGRVTGVETEDGEKFSSHIVVSNADPKSTIMDLVNPRHVETGFTRRINNIRMRGNTAKLHLALDGLPTIQGLDKKALGERLIIAPDIHYVERAFNPAKYGEASPNPVIELTFPGLRDSTLAPTGKHVMSAIVQYAPYNLKGGWTDDAREAFKQTVIATISEYAPDLGERITASELLTPVDIEKEFRITGGHWHHGELALDQFLFVRPVGGAAQYAMPLEGLYLCGAGTHPGGGVSGAAGRNAARTILKREKSA
jgi:phytoene dehydrogenase-like protein